MAVGDVRRGRPPQDPEVVHSRLIDAATKEFGDVGYFGTDTNKIAKAAGASPTTLYKHFTDKLELFLAVYRRWVESEWAAIEAVPTDPDPRRRAGADGRPPAPPGRS